MRQKDIVIGGTYTVRIGARLAPVTVERQRRRNECGRSRTVFVCMTHDTRREIEATAARLRPVAGTIGAEREAARKAAAAAKRSPRPYAGEPGTETVEPVPVHGMLDRIGAVPVLALSAPNRDTIRRIVDGVYVAEPFARVARRVRGRIGSMIAWKTIPRALRRGILYEAARRHAAGRDMYCAVMRRAPLPSPGMVADAVGRAVGLGPMPR